MEMSTFILELLKYPKLLMEYDVVENVGCLFNPLNTELNPICQ